MGFGGGGGCGGEEVGHARTGSVVQVQVRVFVERTFQVDASEGNQTREGKLAAAGTIPGKVGAGPLTYPACLRQHLYSLSHAFELYPRRAKD